MEPKLTAATLLTQQKNLEELKTDLEKLNSKIEKKENLSLEDTKFLGELGWLSALSVTIASVATSL